MAEEANFLDWKSRLDPGDVFVQKSSPSYPVVYKSSLYWLERRPSEGGRTVLVRERQDGVPECLTPADFDISSRVHEMGGRAHVLASDCAWFVNKSDQRIYRQKLAPMAEPMAVTPDNGFARESYVELLPTPDLKFLLFVMESAVEGKENSNTIAWIPLDDGDAIPCEPGVLVRGSSFYGELTVNPRGDRVAWIEWDHPNMPWDDTRLVTARLEQGGDGIRTGRATIIEQGAGTCVSHCRFIADDRLIYTRDRAVSESRPENFWNLYLYEDGRSRPLAALDEDFGAARWGAGEGRFVGLDKQGTKLMAISTIGERDKLHLVDTVTGSTRELPSEYIAFSQLGGDPDQGQPAFVAGSRSAGKRVCRYIDGQVTSGSVEPPLPMSAEDLSHAKHFSFRTSDGGQSHAWFYAPVNEAYIAPSTEKPPLIVMAHGGPTGRTTGEFDMRKQFWTNRGFALLDVNYRGSTGYGRAYRDALRGLWGERDTADLVDAIHHAAERGWCDVSRVCIRGSSAGGYSVLRALTCYPEHFRAGACYYGIGNLVTLARLTHKFEKHYLDGLLGEAWQPSLEGVSESVYYRRSPVNYLNNLKSPVILFQGMDDKIVPPEVSREVVELLRARNIRHEYVEYQDEGHGFRKLETSVDALQREWDFYREVLNDEPG